MTHDTGPVRLYEAYGRTIASAYPLPELREAPAGEPHWRFDVVEALPAAADARALGDDLLYADVHARLESHAAGHRIRVDDTGVFDLSRDRRRIAWERREASWPDFVRAHLLGRVLATALHLEGWLPLHGSAVRAADGVIAFLGAKGYGKSTLALALEAQGAPLVTDDTLPVEPGEPPRAWPGVQSLRVRDDAREAVGVDAPTFESREGKRVIAAPTLAHTASEPVPLSAIYLLDPVAALAEPPAGGAPVPAPPSRERVPPTIAAISLVAHVKIGRMLGPTAAPVLLERAAGVARQVPVYRLRVPRDLERLGAVAADLLASHGGAP